MEAVAHYRDIILSVLAEEAGLGKVDSVQGVLIRDDNSRRFLVVITGWYWFKNHYEVVIDIELSANGQVIIHQDIADESVADRIIEAGILALAVIRAYDYDEMERLELLKREEQTQTPQR